MLLPVLLENLAHRFHGLIDHGIAADRLTPKGYGKGKPKTIKRKVAERYPFLKEGDVLTEEFVMALKDPEQQEQ